MVIAATNATLRDTRLNQRWVVIVLATVCATALHAQNRSADRFEVATIKLHHPDSAKGFGTEVHRGGRVVLSARTLRSLVSTPFRHSDALIANNGDAWIDKEVYDVDAKASADSGIANFNSTLWDIEDARLREMLQSLLIDRFQLRVLRETRTGDVYQLTRTGKPFGMQPAKIPDGRDPSSMYSNIGYAGGRWSMQFMTMAQLARFASATMLRTLVVDLTNVNGSYDYRQQVPDLEPKYDGIERTDSFLRMLSEIGLELKRTKGPIEWLVIVSAARPSPN